MRDKLLSWVLIADLVGCLGFVAVNAFQLFSKEPVTLNNLLFLALVTLFVFAGSVPLFGTCVYIAWTAHQTVLKHIWTASIIGTVIAFAYGVGLLAMFGSDLAASIPFVAPAAVLGALTFLLLASRPQPVINRH